MRMKDVKSWIEQLSIKGVRKLSAILDARRKSLEKSMKDALPPDLRKRFGCYEVTSNLIYNGECRIELFCCGMGSSISKSEKREYFDRARAKIQPVIDAWSKLGIRLDKIYYVPTATGEVVACFKV